MKKALLFLCPVFLSVSVYQARIERTPDGLEMRCGHARSAHGRACHTHDWE
jgi:hypothetical protein